MRRSASEVINDLEIRLAQLEKQAEFDRQAGLSIAELFELGIITKDQYIQAKRVEEMEGKKIPKVGDILYAINPYGGMRTAFFSDSLCESKFQICQDC